MSESRERRKVREFTHRVPAAADRVFPLLCPVRERDWVEYWSCDLVFSRSGFAEENCVFTTAFGDGGEIWTVSRYEPEHRVIEFVIVRPGSHVEKLDLRVVESTGERCELHWTRTYTLLSETSGEGQAALWGEPLDARMASVERMLAHYVETGEMLRGVS